MGFFTLPACKNSFWGALPPMVGQSFLQADSSLPNLDGLASTTIWAKCWVGNDDGDLPNPSNCPASSILHNISSALGGASLAGDGGLTREGGFVPFPPITTTILVLSTLVSPPLSPFLGVTFVLAILEFSQGRLANGEVVRPQSCKSCGSVLEHNLGCMISQHVDAKQLSSPTKWSQQ